MMNRLRNAFTSLTLILSAALMVTWNTSTEAATGGHHTTGSPSGSIYYPYGTLLHGVVTKISDGDTIHFRIESEYGKVLYPLKNWAEGTMPEPQMSKNYGKILKVRMIGIDTAELHLPAPGGVYSQGYWGEEGERELAREIPVGTEVDLHTYGTDTHGRVLGRVYSQHQDINLHMVAVGVASPYQLCQGPTCRPGYFEEQRSREYEVACQIAVEEKAGIHHPIDGLEELPFEFRLRIQQRSPNKYVGDSRTKKLYLPEEYKKVPQCNRIFFPLLTEAQKMGYKPTFKVSDEMKPSSASLR